MRNFIRSLLGLRNNRPTDKAVWPPMPVITMPKERPKQDIIPDDCVLGIATVTNEPYRIIVTIKVEDDLHKLTLTPEMLDAATELTYKEAGKI